MNWEKKKKREFNPKQEMGFEIGRMLEDCIYDLIFYSWLKKAQRKHKDDTDLRIHLSKYIAHSSRLQLNKGEGAPFDLITCNKKVEVKSKRLTSYNPELSEDNLLEEIKSLEKTLAHCQKHDDECIVIVGGYSSEVENIHGASHYIRAKKHKSAWANSKDLHDLSRDFIQLYDEFYVYNFSRDQGVKQLLKVDSTLFSWFLPIWAAPRLFGSYAEDFSEFLTIAKEDDYPEPIKNQLRMYEKFFTEVGDGYVESFKIFTPSELLILAIFQGGSWSSVLSIDIAKLLHRKDKVKFTEELYLAADLAALFYPLDPEIKLQRRIGLKWILEDLKHPLGECKGDWNTCKALSLLNEYPLHQFGSYDESFQEWRLEMERLAEETQPVAPQEMLEAEVEERDVLIDELEKQLVEHSELVKKYELDLRERDQMIDDLVSLLDSATSPEKIESVS